VPGRLAGDGSRMRNNRRQPACPHERGSESRGASLGTELSRRLIATDVPSQRRQRGPTRVTPLRCGHVRNRSRRVRIRSKRRSQTYDYGLRPAAGGAGGATVPAATAAASDLGNAWRPAWDAAHPMG
jgi:hypothetical protein